MIFPKGILKCKRPKMRDHAGRTWDMCRVTLPDGRVVDGYLDTSWGHWFYFQADGQWRKGRIDAFMLTASTDVDLSITMKKQSSVRRNDAPVVVQAPPPPPRITEVCVAHDGSLRYKSEGLEHDASFPLLIIRAAWHQGADFEDLADGFGPGGGTMGGDWSGIRDSSALAINRMLERAMNHLRLG